MKNEIEITKIGKIENSPLTKEVINKDFSKKNIEEYDKSFDIKNKYKNNPIEGNGGTWTGQRGESKWKPYDVEIKSKNPESNYNNPDNKTMGELLEKYKIDGIEYRDGEPDFSPVSKGEVKIENFTEDRYKNFAQADRKLAEQNNYLPSDVKKWRKENGYTWHELRDMSTMQKLPHEIHANIPHSGGISNFKIMGVRQ